MFEADGRRQGDANPPFRQPPQPNRLNGAAAACISTSDEQRHCAQWRRAWPDGHATNWANTRVVTKVGCGPGGAWHPKNLEKITRIFFNHRRKMIKKPFYQLFNGNQKVLDKLNIDLNLRPQNLNIETYYKITEEYENLQS